MSIIRSKNNNKEGSDVCDVFLSNELEKLVELDSNDGSNGSFCLDFMLKNNPE